MDRVIEMTIGDLVWRQCHMGLQHRIEYLERMIVKFPRDPELWVRELKEAREAMVAIGDTSYA